MSAPSIPPIAATAGVTTSTLGSLCVTSSPLSADACMVSDHPMKRSEITAEEKLRVLAWHHANGCNQRRTAAHFQASEPKFLRLNQGTVSRWLLKESKFKTQVQRHQPSVIRSRKVKHPEVERCLALWLDRMPLNQYYKLTGKEVKCLARNLYECLRVPRNERLELSNGWLNRFQARHGLKLQKAQGHGVAGTESCLETERARLQGVVKHFLAAGEGRTLNDVWDMDETSFFFDCSPVDEGADADFVENVGNRLTVMLTTNATGSEWLDPVFIGSTSLAAADCLTYYCNSTAWMTREIFCEWLKHWNNELKSTDRHVLLLVDKDRAHMGNSIELTNIQLEFLSPFLTEFVQPSCIGITDIFHANYRRSVIQRALNKLKTHGYCGDLFGIGQAQAMILATEAWQMVDVRAINRDMLDAISSYLEGNRRKRFVRGVYSNKRVAASDSGSPSATERTKFRGS